MRHLFFPLFLSVVLVGCGGDDNNKSKLPVSNSSESSQAVIKSSSSTSSLISSSSSIRSVETSSSSSVAHESSSNSSLPFVFTSKSFVSGANIPTAYSCYGAGISPHLQWDISSPAIKGFALIMEDIDAIAIVNHPYVHWAVYNIAADIREIKEGATLNTMPAGSQQAINHDDTFRYSPPCPPEGTGVHHYYFTLYALNTANLKVNLNRVLERAQFEAQYAHEIIQKTDISGSYLYK